MHVSVRTFLGAVLHHSQEHNRGQDCFFKMETGILRQATSWTTPYFLVIGGVFLWTFINYLNWDEIDISQRRKHWTLLLQDTGREISDQSTFCALFKTSEWIRNKGGQNISKPELEAFQRKQVCKKKWISSHRAPITVPQAQSPVLSAEQEVSIVSKAHIGSVLQSLPSN